MPALDPKRVQQKGIYSLILDQLVNLYMHCKREFRYNQILFFLSFGEVSKEGERSGLEGFSCHVSLPLLS